MRSSFALLTFACFSAALGLLLAPIHREVQTAFSPPAAQLDFTSLEPALGEGFALALFGGLRSVLADFMWIQAHIHWMERDAPKAESSVRIVVILRPQSLYYWINGARMIALDMPDWILRDFGPRHQIPEVVDRRVREAQARMGIEFLEEGFRHHPNHPRLLIEQAKFHRIGRRDTEAAAELFGEAARQPGAPYYAGRIHAFLLEEMGRLDEAREFLIWYHGQLPPDDPRAQVDDVEEWIANLEEALGLDPAERFEPTYRTGNSS